jgi:hypothetical protein
MANFIANITPVSDIILSQNISIYADVEAADAGSVGSYNVVFVVEKQNADGSWSSLTESGLIGANLTQLVQNFSWSYTPTAIGSYRFSVSVRLGYPTYAWQSVTQTKQTCSVTPIPVVNGFAYYVPISKPPAALNIPALVKQADGSYLPNYGIWQLIPGMSIVDNSVLDTTKWRRKFWSAYGANSDHLNDELERYVDTGVDYQNGQFLMTASPRAGTTGHAPSSGGIQYPLFDSGMVRSVSTATYFFSHLQITFPKQLGIWPAWWIIPGDGSIDPNPEMDMLEFVYNGANETANMIHCNCSANKALLWHDASYHTDFGYLKPSPTFYSADYWVNRPVDICILWTEDDTMTLYHDGNPTAKWFFPWSYRGGQAIPATVMLNLAIGGAWPTATWTTAVPTAPVTVPVNFLKTYTKITSKYGPASPV